MKKILLLVFAIIIVCCICMAGTISTDVQKSIDAYATQQQQKYYDEQFHLQMTARSE